MHGDYDYHHATSNTQFIALIILIAVVFFGLGGLVIGLDLLSSF